MKTLKVFSALLTYPTAELQAAADELETVLRAEAILPEPHLSAVTRLIRDIAKRELFDAQERYVLHFDRTRSLSLHLFEHVHGEGRDRGQAMVDLLRQYEERGFTPTATELPDYLPLFLEFASLLPPEEAIALVAQPGHVLAALGERLAKRQSPYAAVFEALVALAHAGLDAKALAALRAEPDPAPDDLATLDQEWEEQEVIFGPGAADDACGREGLVAKLRQARRPADGVSPPSSSHRPVITTSRAAEH